MAKRNFMALLTDRWASGNFVCVGLDSAFGKIPQHVHTVCEGDVERTLFTFNRNLIRAIKDGIAAWKLNMAFYEAHGTAGLGALYRTIVLAKDYQPEVPIILDFKRGDIGNTNTGHLTLAFDYLGADAVTVNPYVGQAALQPFLDRADKGIIVLCRTSNVGADEFQDFWGFPQGASADVEPMPLYQYVAHRVADQWNANGNCMLVVGATAPEEATEIRNVAGDVPFLVPGVGAQGATAKDIVPTVKDRNSQGFIINSSRGIIFASYGVDYATVAAQKTLELNDEIRKYL